VTRLESPRPPDFTLKTDPIRDDGDTRNPDICGRGGRCCLAGWKDAIIMYPGRITRIVVRRGPQNVSTSRRVKVDDQHYY
jgi:hypothetical protein